MDFLLYMFNLILQSAEKENINTLDAKGDGFIPKRIQNDTSAYGLKRLEIKVF
jgi:hypothetical protein